MSLVKKVADNSSTASLSHSMRYKRFVYFKSLIDKLNKPVTILDIGGTQEYWINMGVDSKDIKITLLNLSLQTTTSPNFLSVVGDATNLSEYANRSFDIVFSNSVIEHLFTKENQGRMAREVMRVGKYHFIQTPNYYFPMEPHFLFPGFQFLPKSVRVLLINKFNLGHICRKGNIEDARSIVEEIRLLKTKEMQELFPKSIIWKEKFAGLAKSIVAHNLS
ncbi:class I SAM-dependent methyltransferase [Flavisolibacter tropicus]|uniref:Methyltransferase type 11 domain-containing protein n=1 Tax=Flavisolibacter tropicus TaxID=1492898 RepID=A0A172TSK4_9BACT|nr:class I SAM-dependent methyltransferase [Flavisolibacter tropicus]ANE50010.1 hypothetical protein SY85_05380 [Flavisolibacter tropicus]